MHGLASRKLPFWIEAFEDATGVLSSPPIFRRWAAICAIAGALERKVWVRTLGSNLYPNLYVVLIAPPGVGKTMALSETERLWRELPDHHVAPTSLTKAALIDALTDAARKIIRPAEVPPFVEFNSLLVPAGELGVLLPSYENDFMNTLTTLYDGHPYGERRRSKDLKLSIPHPQLNLFGATTPNYLHSVIPEGAWDQGFLSRTILVYAGTGEKRRLFGDIERADMSALIHDLKIIGQLYGKISFSEEAAAAIQGWADDDCQPAPEHPKLINYNTRRIAHTLKLSMVAAVSRSDFRYVVEVSDFEMARHWLLEAEHAMGDIFLNSSGGDSAAIDDTWHFVWVTYNKEKKPVAEARVVAHLQTRVPSHSVMRVIDVMQKSNMLLPEFTGAGLAFKPAPKVSRH